jgi:undecaprenyl-diphosphatase
VGLLVFGLSTWLARRRSSESWEREVFHAINGMPGWLYPILWTPMQLGNLVVGALTGIVVAVASGRRAMAWAVLAATALKLVVERLVRDVLTGDLMDRQRPGTSQEGAILRGQVPVEGHSFPSGHVILVSALAMVVMPLLPRRWWPLPWIASVVVALGRVYVGAHNPLDVICGAGLGLAIAGVTNLALGVPAETAAREPAVSEP